MSYNEILINIPYRTALRYRESRSGWDLFVFAVAIKTYTTSSGIHPTINSVMRIMNCNQTRAKRLIEAAKHCEELFYYNQKKNFLVARRFIGRLRPKIYSKGRKKFVAYAEFCIKYRYGKTEQISLNKISRMLLDAIILCPIIAKQRKNDFLQLGEIFNSTRSERSRALQARKLANIAKCDPSTVMRHLHALAKGEGKDKILEIIEHPDIPVFDKDKKEFLTTDVGLLGRKRFQRLNMDVVKDANEYRVLDLNKVLICTNVIFNHKKHHTDNYYSPIANFEH